MTETSFCKATFALPQPIADTAATALSELFWPPAQAVGLFDNEDGTWRVEATFAGRPDAGALKDFLASHGADNVAVAFEAVPEADWVSISQARLRPVRAGRFLVHGSHDMSRAGRSRWAIEIDAAQAFGTAHHGSTRGCLHAIDDLAKREVFKSVLDIGTGTGVLAIAAARVWPARVLASDIDPVAVAIARENIARNGVTRNVSVVTAASLGHPAIRTGSPRDLVIANILARPLSAMARGIARVLRPGGVVVLSGITGEQAGRVAAAYGAAGFARLRRYSLSEWVTLTLRRQT